MKIAYYEPNYYHSEILASFLEYFKRYSCRLTVYYDEDLSKWIVYYRQFYHFEEKSTRLFFSEYTLYDHIIIGSFDTGTSEIIHPSKIIVVHAAHEIVNIKNAQIIVLTPLNYRPNFYYILPIHQFVDTHIHKKIDFIIIGHIYVQYRDTKDLMNFLNSNLKFSLHIFVRKASKKYIKCKLIPMVQKNPNIVFHENVKAQELEGYLKSAKFILPFVKKNGPYHNDRLTGSIALAYNYLLPPILDRKTQNIYQISGSLVYENSIMEVIPQALQMSSSEYARMVDQLRVEREKIVNNNIQMLDKIFRK
jgi:hypothetical protein